MDFTKHIGAVFIFLALLKLAELFDIGFTNINPIYTTCLAISGLCFIFADLIDLQVNFLKKVKHFKREIQLSFNPQDNNKVVKKIFNEVESLIEENTTHFTKNQRRYKDWLFFVSFAFIILFPQITFFQKIFSDPNLSAVLNDGIVFLTIGLTIYLMDQKKKYNRIEKIVTKTANTRLMYERNSMLINNKVTRRFRSRGKST